MAEKVARKFADTGVSAQNADLADALGEMANIVAGQAKAKMDGLDISVSLPRVVTGENHSTLEASRVPVLTVPCDSPLGRFSIEVAMEIKNKPEATTRVNSAGEV